MYAGGQNLSAATRSPLYNASGARSGRLTFPATAGNGQNQQTVLVGDSGVAAAFGRHPRT